VDEIYYVGQTVEGTISRVTQFGAFVSLDPGIEALLHASQISDPAPADPTLLLHEGQVITARIISIEPHRQRLGLSIRDIDNGLDFEAEADDELSESNGEEDEAEFAESDVEEVVAELPESDVEEVVAELPESEVEEVVAEFSESDVEVEVMAELAQSEIEAGASDEDTVESAVVEPPLAEEM
jgi:ribosomal protein S1